MRLVGFSYSDLLAPLGSGYLPIAELGVLVGANDTGKSSLLRLLHRALADDERRSPPGGMFFAACQATEFQALTGHAVSDRWPRESDPEEIQPVPGDRAWWWSRDGLGNDLDAATVDLEAQEPISTWLELLLASATGKREQWELILHAAIAPAVLGLEGPESPADDGLTALIGIEAVWPQPEDSSALWNLFWCLPPFAELSEPVQQAQTAVGLGPDPERPGHWEGWADPGVRVANLDALPGALPQVLNPLPHRRVQEAPIIVAPVGRTSLPILPRTLGLPVEVDELRAEVSEALERALERTGWARTISKTVDEGEGVEDGPGGDEAWVVHDDGAVRPHPDLLDLVKILGATAEEMMPAFVSDHYRVQLSLLPLNTWGKGEKLELQLESRALSGDVFDLEECADGLQLWIQLGLMEALELMADTVAPIGAWADELSQAYQEQDHVPPEQLEDAVERTEAARARLDVLLGAIGQVDRIEIEPAQGPRDYLSIIPGGGYDPSLLGALQLVRGRLYVIDEPERHLHPRLQRQAAQWLSETVRSLGSQAVIASHSVPFMGLRSDVAYSYLSREGLGQSRLGAIDPQSLTHIDREAEELGLDRGELMALVNIFLWVEGRMDQAVLEGLFQPELERYGIAVIPMHSVSRYKGVLEAEALLRFSAAKAAAWFDNVPADFVARLKSEPEYAFEARRDRDLSSESRSLAELVIAARQRELEIEVLDNPGLDVFDLLDEDAISRQFPRFTSHTEAADAWRQEVEQKGRKAGERKAFLAERYQVKLTPASCREIAETMRAMGRKPESLVAVIEACERLALQLD